MFEEYEVVKIKQDMPENNLTAGMTGTVLTIYTDEPPTYEVEFSDDDGITIALLTITGDMLKKVD